MLTNALENSLQKNIWLKHKTPELSGFNLNTYHKEIRETYPVLHQYTKIKNNHLIFTLPPLVHNFRQNIHMSPYTTLEGWNNIFDLKTPNTIIHYNPNYKNANHTKIVRLAGEYDQPDDSIKGKGTYDGNFCTLNTGTVVINVEINIDGWANAPSVDVAGRCAVGTNGPGIFELPGCQTVYSGGKDDVQCRIIKSEGEISTIPIGDNFHTDPVTCIVLKHIKTNKGGMFFFSRMLPSNDSHSFILMEDIDINNTDHDGLNIHGNVSHVYINRVSVTTPHDDCFAVWSNIGLYPNVNQNSNAHDKLIVRVGRLTEGGQEWGDNCQGDQKNIKCYESRTDKQRKAYKSITEPYTSGAETNGLSIWEASHPYKMQSIGYNINFKNCKTVNIHQGSGKIIFYGGAQCTNYNMQGDTGGDWSGISYKRQYCGGIIDKDQYGNKNCMDLGANDIDGANDKGSLCGEQALLRASYGPDDV